MDMSKFRAESHVAQQSLRDKLRVQQSSNLVQQLEEFPPGLNSDLLQVQNVRNESSFVYDPDVFSTGIFHVLPPQRDTMLHQDLETAQAGNRQMRQQQDCGDWKSVDSQHNYDWVAGYASGLAGREGDQDPRFVGEVMSNNARETNISGATQNLKPSYSVFHDVQSAQSNPGSEIYSLESKRHFGNLQFVSPSLYQNSLQGLEVASHEHQNVREPARGSRMDYCGNEANPLSFGNNADGWMNRHVLMEHSQQWGGDLGILANKGSEGLSLSLSSNPTPKICGAETVQFTEGQYGSVGPPSKHGEYKELDESKSLNLGHFCSIQKPSVTNKANGKSLQETGGTSTSVHHQMIPLGPFTGYATILKNSRFLQPAQGLLEEFCQLNKSKSVKVCDTSEGLSGASGSADAPDAVDMDMEAGASKGNNSGASSSTFYSSNESCRPEYQQKKAKLVYMQEEVCRRYKLYHQQMQMVVSSFESVAGLGAATPYFSLAVKTVSSNFRCIRNAILGQIRHISRALGEDLLSTTTGTSSNKGDTINMSRLKYVGQKSGGVNMGFLEPQQHGWRPQRGLPERSVAILRAWLFEHFLHPYPTDTDKHMLATQTGLSRNQVSNWFINARVRVWKPMVEEIHMLESKGLAEGNLNLSRSDGKSTSTEGRTGWPDINRSSVNALSEKQVACSDMLVAGNAHDLDPWNHEKRSRMEFHIPTSVEGSLMGFPTYQQGGFENGGLGAVSLTLGLRHGVESAQQQQQQQYHQQQEHHLRRQFGGHLIHDFAG